MRKTEEEQGAKLVRCALGIVIGGVTALIVCLLFLLAASLGIARGALSERLMYQITVVSCVVGSFIGGNVAVRRCGARSLLAGLAAGGVLFLLLLTVGVLFFRTVSPGSGGIGLLCGCLCGGAVSGLLGGGRKKKGGHGRKKRRK